MMITLSNDFHNSTCRVRVRGPHTVLTSAQEKRAHRLLCGVAGCKCADTPAGTRGPQVEAAATDLLSWSYREGA